MTGSDQPELTIADGILADANPASMALVPVVAAAQWSQIPRRYVRPNSTFVTHLLATAEQLPQTRSLRRATAADAQTAYGAHQPRIQSSGIRTRQII